jgi:hypothetical protein
MIRHLVSNPCQDRCGTAATDEHLDGSPIYRCPGCDSTWTEVPNELAEEHDQPSPSP